MRRASTLVFMTGVGLLLSGFGSDSRPEVGLWIPYTHGSLT